MPVFGCDETGDDAWSAFWSTVLPVGKGFVAEEPGPLAVEGVTDCEVGVERVGRVVRVKALHVAVAGVAVACAVAWDKGAVDPLRVAGKCYF